MEEENLKTTSDERLAKIYETRAKNDFKIYENYNKSLVSKVTKENERIKEQAYAGEIILFLLFLSISSAILGILEKMYYFQPISMGIVLLIFFVMALIASFKSWAFNFIKIISRAIQKIRL